MVSGLMTPLTASHYTFPPELREELLQAVPGYITEVSTDQFNLKESQGKAAYAEALLTSIRVRTKASKTFMKQKPWDVLMVVFTEVDRLQHSFWGHMNNPSSPDQRADQSLRSIASRTYEEIDAALGNLLEDLPDKTQVIVVSDHGFGPSERPFYTNRFLEEHGYLKFRMVRGFPSLRSPQAAMRRILQIMGLSGIFNSKRQPQPSGSRDVRDPKNFQKVVERWVPEDMVNWKRTRAFADQHGIRINMKGREPQGIVAPGSEAELLVEELKNLFSQLKRAHDGKKVFIDVQRKETVYFGPHVDKAPDLITFMEAGTPHPSYRAREIFGALQSNTGAHRKEGIFLAWGEGIRKGKRLERASIMDITPTVCYSLGIPRTIEMDGTVLDIFDGGLDPKRLSERSGTSVRESGDATRFTSEETLEIEAKLRGLGYLD
jgi:predicted AlkP superfamily phosphohydrolase/phosphomutase